MRYDEFKNMVQKWPIIHSRALIMHRPDKQIVRNQLERWCKRKLVIKLRRGVFLLNAFDRKITPSRSYIANQLYSPSYVSLEYALNFYGLIPERVSDVTSITTRKTLRISNEIGSFIYQHIKPEAFRGFIAAKDADGLTFFIAEPEKAIIDFCYLNLKKFKGRGEAVFAESYRLQNTENLKYKKIMYFAGLFKNRQLLKAARSLCGFIRKERLK